MSKHFSLRAGSALTVVAMLGAPGALFAQAAEGMATYVISAETESGMAAAAERAGSKRKLALQLGSSRSAPQPQAEHFVPAALGLGPSVPLVAPDKSGTRPTGDYRGAIPQAKGKMRIIWGCGETVKPGNRREIDLYLREMNAEFEAFQQATHDPEFAHKLAQARREMQTASP